MRKPHLLRSFEIYGRHSQWSRRLGTSCAAVLRERRGLPQFRRLEIEDDVAQGIRLILSSPLIWLVADIQCAYIDSILRCRSREPSRTARQTKTLNLALARCPLGVRRPSVKSVPWRWTNPDPYRRICA